MKNLSLFSYILSSLFFVLFSFLFIDPNLIYLKQFYTGFAFTNRVLAGIFYTILIVLMFSQFLILLGLIKKKVLTNKYISLIVGITASILLFSYPAVLSYDIFNYFSTAKVTFHYFENPYIVMPIELVGDPMLLFTHAANKFALYGPFWILITGFPFILGLNNFILTILSIKTVITLFYLLTIFLIYKLSKNIFSVVLFALNPLVLIEVLVSGHNDIVMMFFALSYFYLLQKKKILLGILFFLLSILIKYATVFLIPVFIYFLFKKIKDKKIDMERLYLYSTLLMLLIFLLSAFREEIYPWYAIWFLSFSCLIKNKLLLIITFTLSFGLLFRYLPYMILGTYSDPTSTIKIIVTLVPLVAGIVYYWYRYKNS